MFNIRNIGVSFIFTMLMFSIGLNEPAAVAAAVVKDIEIQTVVVLQPETEIYWCGNEAGLLGFNTLDAVQNLILALGFKQHEDQGEVKVNPIDKPLAEVVSQVPSAAASSNNNENDSYVNPERDQLEVSRGASRTVTMVATGYTDAPEENYPWAGAPSYIGLPLARGIVAVDPNVIPMGSKLYIEGYGEGIAADQGGAIKGNRIDLFFDSKAEAYDWGMRTIKVTVYR